MSNKKTTFRKIAMLAGTGAAALLLVAVLTNGPEIDKSARAATLNELKAKTVKLEKEIDIANKRAEKLSRKASSLKNTIAELDVEIKKALAKIELTAAKVAQLEIELAQAQEELDRQKGLLKASMRALYVRGDASTVELIVGSDSFSEFMDEQEYLERLKLGIQDSTEKVVELKLKIQAQKEEQEKLLDQQEAAKNALAGARTEKANLLSETRGEEKAFRNRIERLTREQDKTFQEILKRSNDIIIGGGSYPWHHAVCGATGKKEGFCPGYEWHIKGDYRDPWGYFYRNCTSYAAWKINKDKHSVPSLGNGGQWYDNAPKYARGKEPKVGAAVSFDIGTWGHVAYVEAVYGNGQISISEYNFARPGEYSRRTITTSKEPINGYVYPWKL
jgi:surface antigen/peptidoglycan hydrolase CwlO-like protein